MCDHMDNVLFDPKYIFSYKLVLFYFGFEAVCYVLDACINVLVLVGECIKVKHVYPSYHVMFIGYKTCDDFVILDMIDFDIILGLT